MSSLEFEFEVDVGGLEVGEAYVLLFEDMNAKTLGSSSRTKLAG